MPIKDDENVRVLKFGSGDIIVVPAMLDDKLNSVIFVQDTICRDIGSVNTHGVMGKSHRELDTMVVMQWCRMEKDSNSMSVVFVAIRELVRRNEREAVQAERKRIIDKLVSTNSCPFNEIDEITCELSNGCADCIGKFLETD